MFHATVVAREEAPELRVSQRVKLLKFSMM
jgi:hypothetical protein